MVQNFVKYPIGIQSFERIRREGYAYVDKTALVWQLANNSSYYFLGRPRRFGKSLLLSTLEAYFEGKHELFEGLAISQLETEWKKYPILHVDLNAKQYNRREALLEILNMHLERWETLYNTVCGITEQEIHNNFLLRHVVLMTGKYKSHESNL